MARPGRPERNRAARSFRQLRRFHHVINSDKVFGTHNYCLISNITTPSERIGLCTRIRRFLVRFIRPESFVHNPSLADFIITTVRQEKPDASSGRTPRLGKGNEPPHRESSLGLMEATTWVKRRHERRAGRNASEAIEPRDDSNPQADSVVLAGRQ